MILLALFAMFAQKPVDGFQARTYKTMPYRIFVPAGYDKSQKYPLIIWLHGSGSVGRDNLKQISGASLRGTHTWIAPQVQAKHPSFVLAPQSAQGSWITDFDTVIELLKSVEEEFSIDTSRIYVAGQSLGGYGTWHFITTRPDLFAAAVPLCGGGEPKRAAALANIPIWAFHGASDHTVPVEKSREMIDAIRRAGGNPRYTEYKGVDHEVWLKAFQEKDLVEWLFAQRK